MIAVQCGVSFCCGAAWTSYEHTCPPPFWAASPTLPSRSSLTPGWAPCAVKLLPRLSVLHTAVCICQCYTLSHPTFSSPRLRVHKSTLYICVSFPVLQVGSSAPFSRSHVYALMYHIFRISFQAVKCSTIDCGDVCTTVGILNGVEFYTQKMNCIVYKSHSSEAF